ncbi:ANTAR domain-containing protein [Rhodococcus sp. IEGM 1401]|uniref:ANTAR domain-containing protein n=1 Tax=Rhodococcus cerastii TaxID=908616 RepID=A0ABU4D4R2_9NOCA|nr:MULTISPECIES: ANTAR domain-containing protein [Rhodococcus]MCZ4561538.1 ANTAR domain-containing protein [Rhodococcus sp. IEGM 1401]MDI9921582.1 ANTAR domain-containing protein [Rhodococcus sp. IEGM 1372]MDI9927207.1 ANTAR domain-containing protein [Rhodococcus sp. IEGM 1341]MDV6304725.1 ANTAR domain-containing protein [Rhodococcus cerastii]MDV8034034.1 ANTAR domain-containing protein [Rhodococcus sp. IEGM 1414]
MTAANATDFGLPNDVQRALSQRAPIEQAKGMLMAIHRITADAAFALLVDRSQGTNRKLRDIAQELVDTASSAR